MVNSRDRVYMDSKYHELYRLLTDESAPFKTMKDVFMLALAIGFRLRRRVSLNRRQEICRVTVFTPQTDLPFIRALGVAATGDPSILGNQDQLLSIAEEYANAGMEELHRLYYDEPGELTDKLVAYLMENAVPISSDLDV